MYGTPMGRLKVYLIEVRDLSIGMINPQILNSYHQRFLEQRIHLQFELYTAAPSKPFMSYQGKYTSIVCFQILLNLDTSFPLTS
jgi:hypothetical protein